MFHFATANSEQLTEALSPETTDEEEGLFLRLASRSQIPPFSLNGESRRETQLGKIRLFLCSYVTQVIRKKSTDWLKKARATVLRKVLVLIFTKLF
jgi:hypothetical protein